MSFVPAHQVVSGAEPRRTAFVLHGILGSGRNWRTFARKMAARWPAWRFVLVDLRHHGDSSGAPGPNTLASCADDLARLADHLGLRPEAVVGHSFGGKVALTYAREHGRDLAQVWVLDATPEGGFHPSPSDSEVLQVLEALERIPMPLDRRDEVVELLTGAGFSEMLARWMTTNLERTDAGYDWRFDLPAVRELLADYYREDLLPFLDRAPMDVHIVRAERSDRWSPELIARIEASSPRVTLHLLPDAGHWVHVDNPDGLLDLLATGFA